MRPRRRIFILVIILISPGVLLLVETALSQSVNTRSASSSVAAREPAEPARMKIRIEDDLVSGEIRNTPLQDVLEEISSWSGVVFEVPTEENMPVTIAFYSTPLREAILRVVGERNSLVYCDQDSAGQSRISLVRIFAMSDKTGQPSLRYIGDGSRTKTIENVIDTPEQALAVLAVSDNLEARQKAVDVLADAEIEIALPALTMALEDPAPEVIVAAIEGLSGLGAQESLPHILQALKNGHPGVRQSAVLAVSMLGTSSNIKDLKPLERDKDASVAAAAEMAVRKLSTQGP